MHPKIGQIFFNFKMTSQADDNSKCFKFLYFQSKYLSKEEHCISFRVRQFAHVAYVRMRVFIGILIILNMRKLTRRLIFSLWFLKFLKIFLVLIIAHFLNNFVHVFCLFLLIYSGWVSMTLTPNLHIGRRTNSILI